MTKATIPKYVQVFKNIEPNELFKDQKEINEVIKKYDEGGIQIDDAYRTLNPTAKHKFMFVVSEKGKEKNNKTFSGNSIIGYWIYCGKCYIRKVKDVYEFGTYMVYDTKTRKVTGFWDEVKFKKLNEENK